MLNNTNILDYIELQLDFSSESRYSFSIHQVLPVSYSNKLFLFNSGEQLYGALILAFRDKFGIGWEVEEIKGRIILRKFGRIVAYEII